MCNGTPFTDKKNSPRVGLEFGTAAGKRLTHIYIYIYRERERERERESEQKFIIKIPVLCRRERDTERETHRQTDSQTNRQRVC